MKITCGKGLKDLLEEGVIDRIDSWKGPCILKNINGALTVIEKKYNCTPCLHKH